MKQNLFYILAVLITAFSSCDNKTAKSSVSDVQSDIVTQDSVMESSQNTPLTYMLVGTYTAGESNGIQVFRFNTETGVSEYISEVPIENPSYLAINKTGDKVYCVSENQDYTSAVTAFQFDKESGILMLINTIPSGGEAPCYISLDEPEKHVVVANYSGSSLSTFTLNEEGAFDPTKTEVFNFTGKSINPDRQEKPHIHCVLFSPDYKYLYATDLGTDKIHKFNVGKDGRFLSAGEPAAFFVTQGSGPRHLTFHPNGKYAYLINELSGSITAYDYADGNLVEKQSIQADTLNAQGSADIHVSPDGRFLYASNRLQGDGIAIFSIDANDGKLTKIAYQATEKHPRNFAITPNGKFLLVASRDSNMIQVFAIDKETGLLKNTSQDIKLSMPVCIKFTQI